MSVTATIPGGRGCSEVDDDDVVEDELLCDTEVELEVEDDEETLKLELLEDCDEEDDEWLVLELLVEVELLE